MNKLSKLAGLYTSNDLKKAIDLMKKIDLKKTMRTHPIWILSLFFIFYNLAFIKAHAEVPAAKNTKADIVRAQFTSAMQEKEPTDNVVLLSNNNEQIYFFTEIKNYKGGKITHRWEHQGTVMAEVTFAIDGPRWRVYSSKKLKPHWTGIWSVLVLNEAGSPLNISSFEVIAP